MGLDMYLYAEKNISEYDFVDVNGQLSKRDNLEYDKVLKATKMNTLPKSDYASVTIKAQVAYWRKANAIHNWFVRECANGVDNCQDIYVSREQLIELRDECVKAIADRDKATPDQDTTKSIQMGDDPKAVIEQIIKEFQEQVLNEAKKATDTLALPKGGLEPVSGFFFGSTDKDEYYYKQVEYTLDTINALLANDKTLSYTYRASW